jgi:hypothetical protein
VNRALRVGDHVEFRSTEAADDFCLSEAYPELRTCMGGTQKWDETAPDNLMTVVGRRSHEERPVLEVALSWVARNMLVWAAHMRLDNRAKRNRLAQKIEAMKAQRARERQRRPK